MAGTPVQRVSATRLRALFNAHIMPRIRNGDLIESLMSSDKPSAQARQWRGTLSQIVAYHDAAGRKIAIVHRYLRPDGSLGGSGLPDPKMIVHSGTRYTL
jgi:hypothetical protein